MNMTITISIPRASKRWFAFSFFFFFSSLLLSFSRRGEDWIDWAYGVGVIRGSYIVFLVLKFIIIINK